MGHSLPIDPKGNVRFVQQRTSDGARPVTAAALSERPSPDLTNLASLVHCSCLHSAVDDRPYLSHPEMAWLAGVIFEPGGSGRCLTGSSRRQIGTPGPGSIKVPVFLGVQAGAFLLFYVAINVRRSRARSTPSWPAWCPLPMSVLSVRRRMGSGRSIVPFNAAP